MARYKKHRPTTDPTAPSLFDDYDNPADRDISLPGLERHIKVVEQSRTAEVAPLGPVEADRRVLYISFGSGSSGNCTFIGTRSEGILIDAGVDDRRVQAELTRNNLSLDNVKGIILTHDHGDHIRYAYSLLRRHRHMGLYCTPKAFNGILRRHNVSRRIKDYHRPIYKEMPFELAGFKITPFEVNHDGTDNVGFHIAQPGFDFTVATDLGSIGERADHYMRLASFLMIESNYDMSMLVNGHYPEYLKARIMADNGHMDNDVTARYVASIYRPQLKYVFLCHLSNDNNTPEIALRTVTGALMKHGVTVGDGTNTPAAMTASIQVMALPRFESTGIIPLRIDL